MWLIYALNRWITSGRHENESDCIVHNNIVCFGGDEEELIMRIYVQS